METCFQPEDRPMTLTTAYDPQNPSFSFAKMHGAGNDFVLVDDPTSAFPTDAAAIASLCDRRTGIGADGFILLRPPTDARQADIRMTFFNSDGSAAAMCGNGGRCLAAFAFAQGRAPKKMRMETPLGILAGEILDAGNVRLQLPSPTARRLRESIDFEGRPYEMHHLDSGVPHAVHFLPVGSTEADLEAFPVVRFGLFARHHSLYDPAGANVDVALVVSPEKVFLRTYERGVEDETGACGTGAVATVCLGIALGRLSPTRPVEVVPTLRMPLAVELPADGRPLLTGPATVAFTGTARLDAARNLSATR